MTFDGVLGGLGYSQVARLLIGLAERGVRYDLLSLELRRDLDDSERVAAVESEFRRRGISWTRRPYAEGSGVRDVLRNVARATRDALAHVMRGRTSVVHARGYHGALIAAGVQALTGVPYIFDARGYFVDERLEEGRWFTRPVALDIARAAERRMFSRAAAAVTLTEIQAGDVRCSALRPRHGGPVVCIPTCADFEQFALRDAATARDSLPRELAARLEGKLVVGLVGSLNNSYRIEETGALTRALVDARADVHVLVVGKQHEAYRALLAESGVPPARITFTSVPHEAMPGTLRAIDWCPMLLRESRAKRASMPTRLAELFATGVRPLHYGCNAEVTSWVERTGIGYVLPRLDPASFRAAAAVVTGPPLGREALLRGRGLAREHFSLETGIDRYVTLLGQLGIDG